MYEDFESYDIGGGKAGFDTFGGRVESEGENKFVSLKGSLVTAGRYVDSADGMVQVSVRMKQKEQVYARALTVWDTSRKYRSLLIWLNEDSLRLSYDNASKQLQLAKMPENQWVTISAVLNFDTQQIEQVFVDGKACLSEPMAMLNKDDYIPDAGYLEFRTEKVDGTLYLDDIRVEKVLYPEITAVVNEASVLLTRTEGTESGMYPHSAFTMLEDTLNEINLALETEGLSQEEQNALTEKLDVAVEKFENSIILGAQEPLYFNGFESFSLNQSLTTSNGFVAAKNAVVTEGYSGNAVKLTDSSRLLYQYGTDLEGEYYITLSFMQTEKGKVDMLLDASDAVGKGHGPMIYSNGTNIVARDGSENVFKTVIENYSANQWYDLKVYLNTDTDIYTVYVKKAEDSAFEEVCTCSFPYLSDGTNSYVMDKLRRICNVQIYNAGSSVYIDNLGLYNVEEEAENGLNSIEVDYPEMVVYGETIYLSAQAYDRYHSMCEGETIFWSVTEGDATVSEGGVVTVNDGFGGLVKIKAELDNGIYDYANIICLPEAVLSGAKLDVADGNMTVSAVYDILKYTDTQVTAEVVLKDSSVIYDCITDSTGSVFVQIPIDENIASQEIAIVLRDEQYGMQETLTYMHYGNDAYELFVKKFNESDNPEAVIDEFVSGIGLEVNFVYKDHKKEYAEYIKSKTPAQNADEMKQYVSEANLILGVKYAGRDNIEDTLKAGDKLLELVDADTDSLALSSSKTEKLWIELIGYDAKSLSDLGDKIKDIAKDLDSSSSAPSKTPSYSGGGGGGGGGKPSPAVSVSGSGFGVVPPENTVTEQPKEQEAFDDIKEAMWAKDYIEKLAQLNVMNGYNGRVRPNDGITRAEFSKMVVELFGIEKNGKNIFSDVSDNAWYTEYVAAMAEAGIITGYPDGSFCPEESITRQDASVILDRCVTKLGIPVYTKLEKAVFRDSDRFADYASDAISRLQTYGVVSGKGEGVFEPEADITRAETAVMLVKLYSFSEGK